MPGRKHKNVSVVRTTDAPKPGSGIDEIPGLSREVLVERWTEIYGRPPPGSISRRLLEYAAAYDLQARQQGGLDRAVRRRLTKSARSGGGKGRESPRAAKAKALPPGTRLIREWGGRTHSVDVLETGFLYGGKQYRSLSEVARAITGARWSGPRFFGLKDGP